MRIISGSFKGKKISEPIDKKTRPLKDITKESIFNVIIHSNKFKIDFKNSRILDLFSGVGSFGIECLSRGVEEVVFVENYLGVLNILKKNLKSLKNIDNYQILNYDAYKIETLNKLKNKFDIIFLDPPYRDKNIKDLFLSIEQADILKEKGLIILHRHKNENDYLPKNLKILDNKKYGISKITFLTS